MKSFMIVSLRILGSERTKLLTNRKISVSTSPNGLPRPIHLELVNFFFNFIFFSVLFNTFKIGLIVHCQQSTHLRIHHQNCPGPTQNSQIDLEAPLSF